MVGAASTSSQRQASCTLVAAECGVAEKKGTWASATFHIVTAMVGAGVLAMPKALGTLGWIAGPLCVFAFYAISLLASWLLAALFEVDGVQYPRYFEAVAGILGRRAEIVAATFQLSNVVLICIAFSITAAMSMTAVADLTCDLPAPEIESSGEGGCFNQQWKFTIIFGAAQVFLVQLPSLESSWLVSAVGALVAVLYIGIALGLGIGKVADGATHGSVGGITFASDSAKAFEVLNALGTIGFAYGFSQVFLEVQDTIREPPKAKDSMRRAAVIALTLGFVGYLAVAAIGYLAFGDAIPDNILTAFETPKWLVIAAQIFVLINMLASYSLFAQTLFLTLEGWVCRKLGVLHPAEEAALEAVAAALAARGGVSGTGAAGNPPLKNGSSKLGQVLEEGQEEGLEEPLKELHCGEELGGRPPSAQAVLHDSVLSHPSIMVKGVELEASSSARPGSLIHARASFKEDSVVSCDSRVGSIAGPFRMCAGLRNATAKGKESSSAGGRGWRMTLLSAAIRSIYVLLTTAVAVFVPFFGAIVGLIGALVFWPLAVFFPFTMYKKAYQPPVRTRRILDTISFFMFLVSLGAVVGSVRTIIVSFSDPDTFTLFN